MGEDTNEHRSRLRARARVVAVNSAVFLALLGLFDFTAAMLLLPPSSEFMCPHPAYHHLPCPGATRRYALPREDGGRKFVSYFNKSGIRVRTPAEQLAMTDTAAFDIVNIGDSFMEARQVEFDETLAAVLSRLTGKAVLQVGVGSWAPFNYRAWLADNPLKNGVVVNVFIMTNDFYAHGYGSSNASYHAVAVKQSGHHYFNHPDNPRPVRSWLRKHSFIYETLFHRSEPPSYARLKGRFTNEDGSCERLKGMERYTPYARNELMFTTSAKCWDDRLRTELESVVSDIEEIASIVARAKGTVNVFLIPGGWSFDGEVLAGKVHPYYSFDESTVVTAEPVVAYLKQRLRVSVYSLENAIRAMKDRERDRQQWYFSDDAHWTAYGHRRVAEWIAENAAGIAHKASAP